MNIPGVTELAEEVRQGQKDLLVVLLALGDLLAYQGKPDWDRATADVRGRVGT